MAQGKTLMVKRLEMPVAKHRIMPRMPILGVG
jgi:hypothetical protein